MTLCFLRRGADATRRRVARYGVPFLFLALAIAAHAQSTNRAPAFETLPKGGTIVIMPPDVELFEISAGGVLEPKAEWTQAAAKHLRSALTDRSAKLDMKSVFLSEGDSDEVAEINALHAAVAGAIALHHFGPSMLRLPTKEGKLDWSLGEPVRLIKQKTGADYAFFTWIRDSYASAERIAMMVTLALFGIGVGGGAQVGYASLVDLNTGQVLWFNRLIRMHGDLREADKAVETLDTLLEGFPATR